MKIEIKLGRGNSEHEVKFDGVVQDSVEAIRIEVSTDCAPMIFFQFCPEELTIETLDGEFDAMNDGEHAFSMHGDEVPS